MKFKFKGVYQDFSSFIQKILTPEVIIEIGQSEYKYKIKNQEDLIALKEKIKGKVKVGEHSIDIENINEINQLQMTEMQLGKIRLMMDNQEHYGIFKQFCKKNSVSLKLLDVNNNPTTDPKLWDNGQALTRFQEDFFTQWHNEEIQAQDVGLSGSEESKELE